MNCEIYPYNFRQNAIIENLVAAIETETKTRLSITAGEIMLVTAPTSVCV